MEVHAYSAAKSKQVMDLGDRARMRFDRVLDCRKEDTDRVYERSLRAAEVVPDVERCSGFVVDVEMGSHWVCIAGLLYRRVHLMGEKVMMRWVACQEEGVRLLVTQMNVRAVAELSDESGYSAKAQCLLVGMTVGDGVQLAEKSCDSPAGYAVVAEGTAHRSQPNQTEERASVRLMAAQVKRKVAVEPW